MPFLVKVYEHNSDVTFITYNSFKNVDSKGIPSHGVIDSSNNTRSMLAPCLSSNMVLMIEALLSISVSVDQILKAAT